MQTLSSEQSLLIQERVRSVLPTAPHHTARGKPERAAWVAAQRLHGNRRKEMAEIVGCCGTGIVPPAGEQCWQG